MFMIVAPYNPKNLDGDKYFSKVVYLNHFNVTQGLGSPSSWVDIFGTIPTFANGAPGSTTGKFGQALDGARGLYVPGQQKFLLSGDFTIDMWVNFAGNFTSQATWSYSSILSIGSYQSANCFNIGGRSGTLNLEVYGNASGAYTLPTTGWHLVSVQRVSGQGQLFIDGVYVAAISGMNGITYGPDIWINCNSSYANGGMSNIAIDDIRITNGVARYLKDDYSALILGPYEGQPDDYLSSVKMILPFDTDVNDYISPSTHTVQENRGMVLALPASGSSAASAKVGSGCVVLSADCGSYGQYKSSMDFTLGTSNFTLQGWIAPDSLSTLAAASMGLAGNSLTNAANGWGVVLDGPTFATTNYQKRILVNVYNISSSAPILISGSQISEHAWTHWALTRFGSCFTLWINGVAEASYISAASIDAGSTAKNSLFVGAPVMGVAQAWTGMLDETSLTKGICRFPTAFVTPTQKLDLESDGLAASVWALLNFDNSLSDAKAHSFSAVAGAISYSSSITKYGTYSATFNGSTKVACATSSDFDPGTGDFTYEAWVYAGTQTGSAPDVLGNYWSASAGRAAGCFSIGYRSSKFQVFNYSYSTSTFMLSSNSTFATGSWNHIAFQRKTIGPWFFYELYVNGTLEAVLQTSTAYSMSPASPLLAVGGTDGTTSLFVGNVADVRFTKASRYGRSFVPSTAELDLSTDTYASSVVFLARMNDTLADEIGHIRIPASSAGSTSATYGFSTDYFTKPYDKVKYGSAVYLPPRSQVYAAASAASALGSTDFTVELNFCFDGNSSFAPILSNYTSWGTNAWHLSAATSAAIGRLQFFVYNFNVNYAAVQGTTELRHGTWYHAAVVRSGNYLCLFLDGVLEGVANIGGTGVGGASDPLYVAYNTVGGANCRLKGLRITKYARYAPTWAAPTAQASTNAYSKLLLNFEGTSGTQVFTDSAKGRTFTASNAAIKLSNAQAKFGTCSLLCDGVAGHIISSPHTSDLEMFDSPEAFTMSMWIFMPTVPTAIASIASQDTGGGTTNKWLLGLNANSSYGAYQANALTFYVNNGTTATAVTGTFTWAANTWYHIKIVKTGTATTIYVNGTPIVTGFITTSCTFTTQPITIGGDGETYRAFSGYIDDFHLSVGKFISDNTSANFTPADLPALDNTYQANDSLAQYVTLVNNAKDFAYYGYGSPTVSGTAAYDTTNKMFGTSSLSLNGSTSVSYPASYSYAFGTNDFTMEGFIRPSSIGAIQGVIGSAAALSTNSWRIYVDAGGKVRFEVGNFSTANTFMTSTASVSASQWTHWAIVRSGSTFYMYLNGIVVATATKTGSLDAGVSAALLIGLAGAGYFSGQMDEVAIWNFAKYVPAQISVQTSAWPDNSTQDSLFGSVLMSLHGEDFSEVKGHTVSATAGTTSAIGYIGNCFSFAATADDLSVTQDATFQMTGAFTIEAWFKVPDISAVRRIMGQSVSGYNGAGNWQFYVDTTGALNFFDGTSTYSLGFIVAGAWTNVILERYNDVCYAYVGGKLTAAFPYTAAIGVPSNPVGIGRVLGSGGNNTEGMPSAFVDEVRITAASRNSSTIPTTAQFAVPSAEFTYSAGALFMAHFNSSAAAEGLVKQMFTTSGNPAIIGPYVPKYGSGSGIFDGASFLTYGAHNDFILGSSDFCLEGFVTPMAHKGRRQVIFGNMSADATWAANMWGVCVDNYGADSVVTVFVYNYNSSTALLTGVTKIPYGVATHIAIVRSTSSFKLLVNGLLDASGSFSGSVDGGLAAPITLGRGWGRGSQFCGAIDELRYTIGSARYSSQLPLTVPFKDY